MSALPEPHVLKERIRLRLCWSCGERGPHYVPPSFGDDGFYYCTETLVDGRRTPKFDPVHSGESKEGL